MGYSAIPPSVTPIPPPLKKQNYFFELVRPKPRGYSAIPLLSIMYDQQLEARNATPHFRALKGYSAVPFFGTVPLPRKLKRTGTQWLVVIPKPRGYSAIPPGLHTPKQTTRRQDRWSPTLGSEAV